MKPSNVILAIVLVFFTLSGKAQNDTPLEILINVANSQERFNTYQLFSIDKRESSYLDKHLHRYVTLKLDFEVLKELLSSKEEFIKLSIPSPRGSNINLKMVSYDIRTADFQLINRTPEGDIEVDIPESTFYRGIMERGSDATAGISIFEEEVYGLFSNLEQGNINLVKDPYLPGKINQNYIVYFDKDVINKDNPECASSELRGLEDSDADPEIFRENVYDTCEDIEIEVHATYNLYYSKGSMIATYNYISAVFNNVATIFRNERIYTSLSRIVVNTKIDDYYNIDNRMERFQKFGEKTKNTYQTYGGEMAHLMDNVSTGTGGIAWINTLCQNYVYLTNQNQHYGAYAYSNIYPHAGSGTGAFPEYSLPVFMFAHEMGHNLGSHHTQWCGWNGGALDNCAPVEGSCSPGPAPSNGGTIMSYCHGTSDGINFSKGFGDQPGNKIRSIIQSKTCTETYYPAAVQETSPLKTLVANRECTDEYGWTYYFNDNFTSDESDDKWLLAVKKNGEDIGNLDDGSLSVVVRTSSKAGKGSTHIANPGYQTGQDWHVMNRWFELLPTKEPRNPVSVKFPYTDSDFNDVMINQSMITAHTDLTFYKIDSPADPNPDNGHTSVSNNQISFYTNASIPSLTNWKYSRTSTGANVAEFQVSSFSGGGGGFSESDMLGSLPVELIDFEAQKIGNSSFLTWATASEVNNDFFSVERSTDGIQFSIIGRVDGNGNDLNQNNYEFEDRDPRPGINYYRLSQTDFNGTHEKLGIKAVNFESGSNEYSIFPNPIVGNSFSIIVNTHKEEDIKIQIFDMNGRLMMKEKAEISKGENQIMIGSNSLLSGMYLLEVQSTSKRFVQKIIKQ